MTTTMQTADYLRVYELPHRFPVLGRSTWNGIVARGELRTFKIGRARFVRVADVVRFLEGGNKREIK